MADNQLGQKKSIGRILLAEEDHEIRALWRTVLDRSGYDVVPCGSFADLRQTIDSLSVRGLRSAIDLVVCDARLLNDDLQGTISRLQSVSQFPTLVIIAAYRGKQLLAQMKQLNIKAVFDQPFQIQQQLAVVRTLVPPVSEA